MLQKEFLEIPTQTRLEIKQRKQLRQMLQKEFLEIPSQIRLEIKLRKLRWKDDVYILHTIPKKYVIFKAKEVFCNQYFIRLLFFIPWNMWII